MTHNCGIGAVPGDVTTARSDVVRARDPADFRCATKRPRSDIEAEVHEGTLGIRLCVP